MLKCSFIVKCCIWCVFMWMRVFRGVLSAIAVGGRAFVGVCEVCNTYASRNDYIRNIS